MENYRDYSGRTIRLTDERLAHILEHPEMVEMASQVPQALRQPERVIQSRTDPRVRLYYRYESATLVGEKWLCIVVKSEVEDHFILTAYLTDKPKIGVLLWPSR